MVFEVEMYKKGVANVFGGLEARRNVSFMFWKAKRQEEKYDYRFQQL